MPIDLLGRGGETLSQEAILRPILRLRLAPARAMAWRLAIPMMMHRGCRNLVRMAEQRSRI